MFLILKVMVMVFIYAVYCLFVDSLNISLVFLHFLKQGY